MANNSHFHKLGPSTTLDYSDGGIEGRGNEAPSWRSRPQLTRQAFTMLSSWNRTVVRSRNGKVRFDDRDGQDTVFSTKCATEIIRNETIDLSILCEITCTKLHVLAGGHFSHLNFSFHVIIFLNCLTQERVHGRSYSGIPVEVAGVVTKCVSLVTSMIINIELDLRICWENGKRSCKRYTW